MCKLDLITHVRWMLMNDLPGQANEVSLDLSHPFHAGFSFAAVGVAHDELPGAVGLSAQNLDRLVASLGRLSRCIDRIALKVGV